MNDEVKKFSFFGLPKRVYELEQELKEANETSAETIAQLQLAITNLTSRVEALEATEPEA